MIKVPPKIKIHENKIILSKIIQEESYGIYTMKKSNYNIIQTRITVVGINTIWIATYNSK